MAQFTLRHNDTQVHVQEGDEGSYHKYDAPATPEIVAYFHAQIKAGNFTTSLYGTNTKYVPAPLVTELKHTLRVTIPAVEVELPVA